MIKRLFIILIRLYQKISGFFPRKCRFYPTCSQYMLDAVNAQGLLGGISLGVRRIIRCHPFNNGGYDPVLVPGNNKGKVMKKVDKR